MPKEGSYGPSFYFSEKITLLSLLEPRGFSGAVGEGGFAVI